VRVGARIPATLVPRGFAAQARDFAVHAQRIELEGLRARNELHRRVELQVDVGGVVDEQVADRSSPDSVGEAALGRQVQAGLARQRVGPNDVILRRAVERRVELRE
jgi:hypothetical protein